MHPLGPLQGHKAALESWQQIEGQRHEDHRKDYRQDQRVGPEILERYQDQRRHDVPCNKDRQIGRPVIGALMVQFLAADRAGVADLEVSVEHRPRTAIRAQPFPPEYHGRFGRAL